MSAYQKFMEWFTGVMVRARYQDIMIELPTDFELAQINLYRTVK